MEFELGRGKRARRAYGFDEVALVPGTVTINPAEIDVSFQLDGSTFDIPFLAAAMDGVVDPRFAVAMGRLGGLAVLNLDGLQTRYEDPSEALQEIADTPPEKINLLLQRLYTAPVQDGLIGQRIEQIKHGGVRCAVSSIPNHAERRGPLVQEAGADVLVVQGTVLTARHVSRSYRQLSFRELTKALDIPVVVGNCVDYATALELMDTGIKGLLVGVGPGAACTTRAVLGVGVPQVTATSDCAAARDDHLRRSGERVAIITDGGMRIGGDVTKAFASGADAVMIGSIFAATEDAAGHGNHWGMATPDPNLPRGTRIRTGIKGRLEEVLFGPAHVDDGSMNLVGALKSAMGVCGARTIREFQDTEMVIAPSIKTEGKTEQRAQRVGMGA
ncbi:MAG: inosine 5-monophosphate dehydrogenase [Chloroflexi bacterium]|jgi:IMP dehydrogenase|nr:inosine 5-monophosphate dehydrogenase [Chloroflexota bacterium]MEA2618060.1 dehydrogenase [Chloroflexota bacterium]